MGHRAKCGVVGVGYLGQHHARIYSQLANCELVGVYDVNPTAAATVAEAYKTQVFPSIEALAEACDAVSVVVPTDKHCDVALQLFEKKCHLLIEKPLCVSLEEAERILEASKRNQCIVQVGHIEHFNPVMAFLEQAVESPRYIVADRLAPFNPRGTEVGVVLDLMIHDIGIILQLVRSPVNRVESIGVNVLSAHDEDIANARIVFENGCIANLNTSRVSLKKVREIRIFQQNAYLSLDFMNQVGHLLRKQAGTLHKEDIPIEKGEPLALELASFVDCVQHHKTPKVNTDLGRTALALAIEITSQIQDLCKIS
ncbi:MAG: oxidoreductase [Verrucomicrobia bacterium GWF2_51_19]|nr:MAG: oxidoreductase [Verrucomicrobia bacterium GWF2_51_19]HCJ12437.1 oxidoreductase [Opitutae bacterium]